MGFGFGVWDFSGLGLLGVRVEGRGGVRGSNTSGVFAAGLSKV